VQQLSGLDASFLYVETPTLHMHTIKVAVVDPRGAPGGYAFERVRASLLRRLDRLPPFRRRLVRAPFGLGHPYWIEDPDFELNHHLGRRRAPHPGGRQELCQVVGEIAGRPLDRSRPLWELTVVEGLQGGRIAFVAKLHHCIADGMRALELLMAALGVGEVDELPAPWRPERPPQRSSLLRSSLRSGAARLRSLPGLLLRTLRGVLAVLALLWRRPPRSLPHAPPRTSFNVALGRRRTFAVVDLPMQELRELKRRNQVTLNDVVLCLCAEALRDYLAERGELPHRSLVAGIPTSTRGRGLHAPGANHVGHLMAPLHTEVADPLLRLQRIHQSLCEAKARSRAFGEEMLERWAEFMPPRPTSLLLRAWSRLGLSNRTPPPINLVASNVPGPAQPLSVDGAHLEALYSVGPILEGIGLNLTAWSYAGRLQVAALGCPESLPEPWKLVRHLPEALARMKRESLAA